ncbi:hypothetical protein IAU60_004966 [Kwoniella sp. DSM 27419]
MEDSPVNKPHSSSRPSSSRTRNPSSSSQITRRVPTSVLELGSPMTSPVKSASQRSASPARASPGSDLAVKGGTGSARRVSDVATKEDEQSQEPKGSSVAGEEREVMALVEHTAADADVDMNGEDTGVEDEGAEEEEEAEGEGEEGSGSDEDEDEEEEDEEEDDEEDDEDSGDESEDLGGSPEIMAIDGPNGPSRLSLPPNVKLEPGAELEIAVEGQASTAVTADGTPAAGDETAPNVLVPKKKKRVRPRSPSEDVAPPPPIKTIRLEKAMLKEGETLEWNILDDAREQGMIAEIWAVTEEEVPTNLPMDVEGAVNGNGMGEAEASNGPTAGPSSRPLFSNLVDEDPEEIARRLEEKYGDAPKPKKTKIKKFKEDYDVEDPFIDDSEIHVDEPTHFARPKKEGFFVQAGALELLVEEPVKAKPRPKAKPRSSNPALAPRPPRKSLSTAVTARRLFKGSRAEPISIDNSDDENTAGPSRPSVSKVGSLSPPPEGETAEDLPTEPVDIDRIKYKNASKDPRLLPPYISFPTAVRRRLLALREKSEEHSWSTNVKGKFPDHLRAYLQAAGRAAYEHELFGLADREGVDKSFFHALPSALPYNEFTLRKLVTKLCFHGYWQWLQDCEEEGINQLKEMVDKDKDEVLAKYNEAHKLWESEVQSWDEQHPQTESSGPASGQALGEAMTIDALVHPSGPKVDDVRPPEPPRRFVWTPDMRDVFAQLLENMQDIVDLKKKADDWNIQSVKTGKEWSEQAVKIRLYKKINDVFPEGFMNTSIISREMTKVRAKKKTQTDQDGE